MPTVDKKDVLDRMIYNILEGLQTIEQAKADAEQDYNTTISLQRGDLVYIQSKVKQFIEQNEQWYDDDGKLVTSEIGQALLILIR